MTQHKCEKCGKKELAVNYKRGNKVYYRRVCNSCERAERRSKKTEKQLLTQSGYRKRSQCDRCGFRAKVPSQMQIVYIDGNKHNVAFSNLRSYCLNCVEELKYPKSHRQDHLLADY